MSEEIKALIEKIQQEGIKAAEEKAKEIEAEANLQAEKILKKARADAEQARKEAEDSIALMREKEKNLLDQAVRDFLLTLRQEINAMLGRIVAEDIKGAFTPENLFTILQNMIKCASGGSEDIIISLSKEDAAAIAGGSLAKLKDATKKKIELKPQDDIRAGFLISFDGGKSEFDFSDKALAEYIGTYLKPKLGAILNQSK